MIKKNITKIILIIFTSLSFLTGCSNLSSVVDFSDSPPKEPKEKIPLDEISAPIIPDIKIANPKIVVKKSNRALELFDDDVLVASFPIGLGFTPEGAKTEQGDGKTPEGEYYVCTKNPNSRYHLSLGVSYPNKNDAQRALDAGGIDEATYNNIATAIGTGKRPPWNTALGGEIMIHGNSSKSDWTAGCVAVENEVMDFLFEVCDMGTEIVILP